MKLNPELKLKLELKLLLLLLMLLDNAACSVYMSTSINSSITSDIYKKMDDVSKCRCKAECAVQTSCAAVSYDAGARQCLLGGARPENVTTHGAPNTTTYFKFQRNEQDTASEPTTTPARTTTTEPTTTASATTTAPATTTEPTTTTELTTTGGLPLIFTTAALTKDGKVANQERMCAAENGVPITINTKKIRAAAANVTNSSGKAAWGSSTMYAWIVARDRNGDSNIQWSDGTNVVDGITFVAADVEKKSAGPSTFLREDGKIEHSAESTYSEYPVLCVRA